MAFVARKSPGDLRHLPLALPIMIAGLGLFGLGFVNAYLRPRG